MGNKDLKEEILDTFLIALDEDLWTAAMKAAEESGSGKPLKNKKLLNKSTSPLYPEEHGPAGVIDPESEAGQKQQAHIRKQIDSSGEKGYHYGYEGSSGSEDEGGVERPMKDFAEKYAKEKGVKFSTGTLEDERTDIEGDLRSTKIGRFLIKKYGPEQAEAMKAAYLADEGTPGYKAAYGQEDYPGEEQTPMQARFNQAQQIINRLRRHGVRSQLRKAQKGGKMVGGGLGAGHFREQIRNAVLEYLSPEAYASRTQKSADIARRQAPKRAAAISKKFDKSSGAGYYLGGAGGLDHDDYDRKADRDVPKLAAKRKERVARVQRGRGGFGPTPNSPPILRKPTKLSKRGFDDQDKPYRPVKVRKPSYDLGHRIRTGGHGTTGKYGTAKNLSKVLKGEIEIDKDGGGRRREQRGITGEEAIQIRNAFLNYLFERKNEDPKGMAFKAGAGQDSEWGPPTKYGDEATRKSVAASAWATRKKLREPGRSKKTLSPKEKKDLRFKVHQGWSKAASTSPHQTPEQKERRSKLIRKTKAGYEKHTEKEKAKDDQFADIGRQAVEKHEKNRRRPKH